MCQICTKIAIVFIIYFTPNIVIGNDILQNRLIYFAYCFNVIAVGDVQTTSLWIIELFLEDVLYGRRSTRYNVKASFVPTL